MGTPRSDITRIDNLIRQLLEARTQLPTVRARIDAYIDDELAAQGQGKGSGISDPTGAQALRIGNLNRRHRNLNQALASIERNVTHLTVELDRAQTQPNPDTNGSRITRDQDGTLIVDTTRADIDYTKVASDTCPNMVMRTLNITLANTTRTSQRLERCGQITANKLDDNGTIIGIDPDGYCTDCRTAANARATDAALAEALLARGA